MDMETRLEKVFRPVRPSRTFVQTVRSRIYLEPPEIVADRLDVTPRLLVLIAAVVSAVLLVAGIRAVFYVLNKHNR
jgi:hypothetical protein